MIEGLLTVTIIFIPWFFLGAVGIAIASVLCQFVLRKIAGGTVAIICACLAGIAIGSYLTVLLLAHIFLAYFPQTEIQIAQRLGPVAIIVGGILGCGAAIFFMRTFNDDLSRGHN